MNNEKLHYDEWFDSLLSTLKESISGSIKWKDNLDVDSYNKALTKLERLINTWEYQEYEQVLEWLKSIEKDWAKQEAKNLLDAIEKISNPNKGESIDSKHEDHKFDSDIYLQETAEANRKEAKLEIYTNVNNLLIRSKSLPKPIWPLLHTIILYLTEKSKIILP